MREVESDPRIVVIWLVSREVLVFSAMQVIFRYVVYINKVVLHVTKR